MSNEHTPGRIDANPGEEAGAFIRRLVAIAGGEGGNHGRS